MKQQLILNLYRLLIVGLVLTIAALGIYFWASGRMETKNAWDNHRRVMIQLPGGEVKMAEAAPAETPAPQIDKPAPTAEQPAAAPPVSPESPIEAKPSDATPSQAVTPETPSPAAQAPVEADIVVEETPGNDATSVPKIQPSATRLADPKAELGEVSKDYGTLPVIAPDGVKPYDYYSKSVKLNGKQPMIAIIVTGLAQRAKITEDALDLPENISFSVSPYAPNVKSWIAALRLAGHEVLFDLPMEPVDYPASDPGPKAMMLGNTPEENLARLSSIMGIAPGPIGFLTPQSDSFTAGIDGFKNIVAEMAKRGMLLVLGKEPFKNETRQLLEAGNSAYTIADILVDEELLDATINARLITLEQLARKNGSAIGIAQAYPLTIKQLKSWSEGLNNRGLQLVPVSAIVKGKFQ